MSFNSSTYNSFNPSSAMTAPIVQNLKPTPWMRLPVAVWLARKTFIGCLVPDSSTDFQAAPSTANFAAAASDLLSPGSFCVAQSQHFWIDPNPHAGQEFFQGEGSAAREPRAAPSPGIDARDQRPFAK